MDQPKKIDSLIESDDEDMGMGRDWMKVDHGVKTDGFRIGMESSQEQVMQKGFNQAFREALQMALAGGKLQGGICAGLTYTPSPANHPAGQSTPSVPTALRSGDDNTSASSPLQQLLSSNTELISSIPSLLNNDLVKSMSLKLGNTSNLTSCCGGMSCSNQDVPSAMLAVKNEHLSCSAVVNDKDLSGDAQGQDRKGIISCEDLCSNKDHFWSQLESFKTQAQAFGVVANDL